MLEQMTDASAVPPGPSTSDEQTSSRTVPPQVVVTAPKKKSNRWVKNDTEKSAFMRSRIAGYEAAQETRTQNAFILKTHSEYEKKWPSPTPEEAFACRNVSDTTIATEGVTY